MRNKRKLISALLAVVMLTTVTFAFGRGDNAADVW